MEGLPWCKVENETTELRGTELSEWYQVLLKESDFDKCGPKNIFSTNNYVATSDRTYTYSLTDLLKICSSASSVKGSKE